MRLVPAPDGIGAEAVTRVLTQYEHDRLELLLTNWGCSKAGLTLANYASTSAYDDQVEARSAEYATRYPILQVDADRVDAIVYGRAPTQLLPAVAPMRIEWRLVLELRYIKCRTQADSARLLKVAQQTVADRLRAAKLELWNALQAMEKRPKPALGVGCRAVGKSDA